MKKMNLKLAQNELSRKELKEIMAGSGSDGGNVFKCCWSGTTNCSVCTGYGSCVSGASLVRC